MAVLSQDSKLVLNFQDSGGVKFSTNITEANPEATENDIRAFSTSVANLTNGEMIRIQQQVNSYFAPEVSGGD